MSDADMQPAAKTHPATREMLPDDPLGLHAVEVPGNADVMLCMLVEEYARMGWDLEAIVSLARDPFYQAFHALYSRQGEDVFRRRVSEILGRVGVTRVTVARPDPPPVNPVQIQPPASSAGRDDDA